MWFAHDVRVEKFRDLRLEGGGSVLACLNKPKPHLFQREPLGHETLNPAPPRHCLALAGQAFLKTKEGEAGVQKLPSGLMYKAQHGFGFKTQAYIGFLLHGLRLRVRIRISRRLKASTKAILKLGHSLSLDTIVCRTGHKWRPQQDLCEISKSCGAATHPRSPVL